MLLYLFDGRELVLRAAMHNSLIFFHLIVLVNKVLLSFSKESIDVAIRLEINRFQVFLLSAE